MRPPSPSWRGKTNRETLLSILFFSSTQRYVTGNVADELAVPNAVTNDFGIFATGMYGWGSNSLQAGIRFDNRHLVSDEYGVADEEGYFQALDKKYNSFNASLGYKTNFAKDLTFRLNVATGFRAPNLAELSSNGVHEGTFRYEIGNPNLKTEQNVQTDLDLEYKSDHFEFSVSGFYNHINNYIYSSPTGAEIDDFLVYNYIQNNANLYGGEAGLHIHPSIMEWLHFETTFSTVTAKQDNGEYLPFIPANKLNVELRAEKSRLAFLHNCFVAARTHTASKQHHAAPDETPTNGYTLLDVNIGASLKAGNQSIVLGMGVANVFDKQYIDHLSTLKEVNLNNAGRNMVFSITYAF